MWLHSLSSGSYGPHGTPESGKSLLSWCSVNSSRYAGLLFSQLQWVDGDDSHGYHSHQDPYSVTMCVVLGFALAGQLRQMPATAHSIPRTSELLLHGLLLNDLGQSRPLWAWLWIQRDFANPGIWAAFLCVHHCPFLHTYGIYPHYPQKTSLGTTSNNKVGQEEVKIAPPFVEEVNRGVHFHICHVPDGVPLLFCHPGQVWDTPQVRWQALAERSLSAIRKLENPPKYRVAIHRTIVQKSCSHPLCLLALTKNMLVTIYKPSMLLKHHAKFISPQESLVLLAHPQCNRDQWGVHSASVSERVVFHCLVSILTTSLSSMTLQSVSSGAPHPVELLCFRSG